MGARFNWLVKKGKVRVPIVIGCGRAPTIAVLLLFDIWLREVLDFATPER